jgi:hypothetical protein
MKCVVCIVVKIWGMVFLDITLSSLTDGQQGFGKTCCLQAQGRRLMQQVSL